MLAWAGLRLERPLVMGILNVTPDSFSDGGLHFGVEAAVAAGRLMLARGADILDVGGESTRPGAAVVSVEEELARVVPVVRALAAAGAVVSLDTRNAAVMAAGLAAGARIVNDVSGLTHDPEALGVVARAGCPVILMHMRGTPETMGGLAVYADVVGEVEAELLALRDRAVAAGVRPADIVLDPGFGFAKRGAQNVTLLRATARLAGLGHPLLVALSRKRFLGEISGEAAAGRRDAETLAACCYAVGQGAHIVRVHDVDATIRALRVWKSVTERDDG